MPVSFSKDNCTKRALLQKIWHCMGPGTMQTFLCRCPGGCAHACIGLCMHRVRMSMQQIAHIFMLLCAYSPEVTRFMRHEPIISYPLSCSAAATNCTTARHSNTLQHTETYLRGHALEVARQANKIPERLFRGRHLSHRPARCLSASTDRRHDTSHDAEHHGGLGRLGSGCEGHGRGRCD